MWRHQQKGTLLRNKQCHPWSAVFTLLGQYFWLTLRRERQKCYLFRCSWAINFIGPDQTRRICAASVRAYNICPAIKLLFGWWHHIYDFVPSVSYEIRVFANHPYPFSSLICIWIEKELSDWGLFCYRNFIGFYYLHIFA